MGRLQNRVGVINGTSDIVSEYERPKEKRVKDSPEAIKGQNAVKRYSGDLSLEEKHSDDLDDILGKGNISSKRSARDYEKDGSGRNRENVKVKAAEKSSGTAFSGGEYGSLFSDKDPKNDDVDEPSELRKNGIKENHTVAYGTDHPDFNAATIENELSEIQRLHRTDKLKSILSRTAILFMVAGCVYAVFLVFGVIMTDYGYNSNGEVEAQVLTVADIRARNDYDVIKVQYEKLRVIYEDILQLDAQLAEAVDGYAIIGGDYAGLMDKTEDLGIKTDALTVESKYQPTKELMYSWIKEYAWSYLVAISQALTNNDSEAADSAVVYKNYMYTVFANLTDNVITLGTGVKGVDLDDIRMWDPDTYKQDYLNGKTS